MYLEMLDFFVIDRFLIFTFILNKIINIYSLLKYKYLFLVPRYLPAIGILKNQQK